MLEDGNGPFARPFAQRTLEAHHSLLLCEQCDDRVSCVVIDLQLDQLLCHKAVIGAGVEALDGVGAVPPGSGEVPEEIFHVKGIEPGENFRRIHLR